MIRRHAGVAGVAGLTAGLAVVGCGSRPPSWNVDPTATAVGLSYGVALVDDADHQVAVLTATGANPPDLNPVAFYPVGHNVVTSVASADGSTLFVLATGDPNPTTAAQQPSLTTIQIDSQLGVTRTPYSMPMGEAFQSLAVDPAGQYAVAYDQEGFVENQNELVIFDLTGAHDPPFVTYTIQSFGGTPQQMTFTPELDVAPTTAQPQRRLLIIQTQIDVSLIDLDHAFDDPPRPEITIPLTTSTSGTVVTPAAVTVDSFDPTSTSDAQFALSASNQSDVFTFSFGPPGPTDHNDFEPILNETSVGGVPSDMAFVHDDQGNVWLATLVPSTASAVLVQPSTSVTSTVTLQSAYSHMSLVTGAVPSASSADVALLWGGGGASGVALWTVGQPSYTIETPEITASIQTVLDVPSSTFKVLEPADAGGFYLLDLSTGGVTPLSTMSQATISISPDGQRVWAFSQGGTDLALTPLTNPIPTDLTTTAPISSVYDVGAAGGGRALVTLDMQGTIGATLFDALAPTTSRRIPALLLEGP